ncbi:MAG TPA: hypothetical protein VEU62_16110 [Bryobacterales bacterium]|nr:hypothetical protein [Bryobacterales bacterium]
MQPFKRHLLWIALLAQALLLGFHLDLLPIWGDERYTLETAAQSPPRIIAALQVDVHPPVYYFLVKGWLKLPLPGEPLERARALSAAVALLATLALDLLWLRPLAWETRALFLGLWVFSPFLILYARMARSYTLQLLLTLIAIRMARDWLRDPADRWKMARYVLAAAALLYTHYLPGLAVVAGAAVLGLWRRQWRQLEALALIALAYAPWLSTLVHTSAVVAEARPHWESSNFLIENGMKLAYAFVAFNFGESIPAWGMMAGAALLPLIGWALWKAWERTAHPPVLFLLVAMVGYLGAASWVTFAFVGARLLFLLPFYFLFLLRGLDLRRWHGALTYAGILLVAAGSLSSYYRKQDFLNKGYLVDFEQIARELRQASAGEPNLILLDRQISNAGYALHAERLARPVLILGDGDSFDRALAMLHHHRPALVWYLGYGRDLTPGGLNRHFEAEVSRDYSIERHGFVPFSWADRKAMQWLGQPDRPAYLIEALELHRQGGPR